MQNHQGAISLLAVIAAFVFAVCLEPPNEKSPVVAHQPSGTPVLQHIAAVISPGLGGGRSEKLF